MLRPWHHTLFIRCSLTHSGLPATLPDEGQRHSQERKTLMKRLWRLLAVVLLVGLVTGNVLAQA